jgi:hypothetical protein
MSTVIKVKTQNIARVNINASSGSITSANPITIKNLPATSSGVTRLDQLFDVVATNETDKATLVYDAVTDKYVVQPLEFGDITGDLDGGTF